MNYPRWVGVFVNGVWECMVLTVMLGFCKPSAYRGELRKMWLWGLIIWPSGLLRWKATMHERRVQFPHCVSRADIVCWNTRVLPPAFIVVTLDSKEHTALKLPQRCNFTCEQEYTLYDKFWSKFINKLMQVNTKWKHLCYSTGKSCGTRRGLSKTKNEGHAVLV